MIDGHEAIFGPVADRSIFDGEIVVPPHLRNMSATLGNRSSRLLGSLNRSRTFLTLPTNGRQSYIHGSVPDLSRSVSANTPTTTKKQLNESVDSVVELEEDASNRSPLPSRITKDGVELRRKSEQDVHRILLPVAGHKPSVFTTTPSHYRNNSSGSNLPLQHSSVTVLPFRVQHQQPQSKKSSLTSSIPLKSFFRKESPLITSSQQNISTYQPADQPPSPSTPSKWGNVRNSNSFSNDFNVASLSTKYTIPRPHLVPVALTEDGGQTIVSDQQIILNRMGTDDSAA